MGAESLKEYRHVHRLDSSQGGGQKIAEKLMFKLFN
jgi:hypothetical protein